MTDNEVKDFVGRNSGKYLKSKKGNVCSKLNEVRILEKVVESLSVFVTHLMKMIQSNSSDTCVHCYNIEILNLFDPELQLIKTNSMIKNKLKIFSTLLKKFKVQTILVLEYKKGNDQKLSIQLVS